MASIVLRVLLCLALAGMANCAQKLSALPKNITVTVTGYTVGGEMVKAGPPCLEQERGGCQQVLQAAEDSVMVSYAVPGFLQKPGATVKVVGCYSAYSGYDRAWRKPNPASIAASKDCPWTIAKGLKAPTGNVTWALGEKIPDSTVYVRAYLMSPPADDGTMTYLAYGNSKGFIQVDKINDIPVGLKAAVAVCCCISPIMLAAFMIFEKYYKKTE